MDKEQPRRPNRAQVPFNLRVAPEVKLRAERDAADVGAKSVASYVASLIEGAELSVRAGAVVTDLALAGHRIMVTLDAVRERLAPDKGAAILAELQGLRHDVTAALLASRSLYDAELDRAGVNDDWSIRESVRPGRFRRGR